MVRLALSILVQLIANAIGLIVAASLLDDMSLQVDGFLLAVGVFTLVNVVILPLIQKQTLTRGGALSGSTALAAALIALVVTTLVSDSMTIDGLTTWVVATLIVWAASLVATLLLPVLVFKRLREDGNR